MSIDPLPDLLKLSASDRADLAMAIWESPSYSGRETEHQSKDADRAELDGRWTDHVENPDSAIPWSDVRAKYIS